MILHEDVTHECDRQNRRDHHAVDGPHRAKEQGHRRNRFRLKQEKPTADEKEWPVRRADRLTSRSRADERRTKEEHREQRPDVVAGDLPLAQIWERPAVSGALNRHQQRRVLRFGCGAHRARARNEREVK